MQALSPQLKEEKDADSWSNPDSHAQVANMVEFKVDEDAYEVSLNHRWGRYTIYSAFPGEILFPEIMEVHSSKWILNPSMRSQFSSNSIFLGQEGSLVGYEVEKALAIAREIIPAWPTLPMISDIAFEVQHASCSPLCI